jgi:hypothetical protein
LQIVLLDLINPQSVFSKVLEGEHI